MARVQIRDIPDLQASINSITKVVQDIKNGPFVISYGLIKTTLTVGYSTLDQMNGYTLDISGNTRINGSTLFNASVSIKGKLDVDKDVTFYNDLYVMGNIASYSDKNIKYNITKLESCLESIERINGYRYNRTDLSGQSQLGLIAQEVEINYPEIVFEKNEIKSINYSSFIAVLLECIKELNTKIEILENKILI
jgi:hypothetical protein